MNRLEKHLSNLKQKQEKGLVLYISAGDPDIATTLEIMKALAENGVDCIELGVPFSDPTADGPVIQRASQRALKNNVNLKNILDLLRQFRESYETPILLMGYYNPVFQYGLEVFTKDLAQAGGDGLIVADLPWEESEELETYCLQNQLSLIQLVAPDMAPERTKKVIGSANGFIYCISNYGTTGAEIDENTYLKSLVGSLKELSEVPVAIGFGISSVEKAKSMSKIGDCVIVGSWLIAELEKSDNKPETAARFTKALKEAISK